MRVPVRAPVANPPLYGLVAAVATVEQDDLHWPMGTTFFSEGCGGVGLGLVNGCGQTDSLSLIGNGENVNTDGFVLWATEDCTTLDGTWRDFQARARRQLEAGTSYALAKELWEGDAVVAGSSDNQYLSKPTPDEVTASPESASHALGCLVGWLADALHGGQGLIHVTPALLVHLMGVGLVIRKGNLWVTAMDHVVVADAGYSGVGPAEGQSNDVATTQWMYASPLIDVTLGPIRPVGQNESEELTISTNDRFVYMQRAALVQFQRSCGIAAAEVDWAPCALVEGS